MSSRVHFEQYQTRPFELSQTQTRQIRFLVLTHTL